MCPGFKNLFPNDPRSTVLRQKGPETKVRNFLNERYEGFIHDHPIYTGNCDCTHRRRIDHRKLVKDTLLCVETDENCHRYYDKTDEKNRYDDVMMVSGMKLIFIRFNPDSYSVKGVRHNPLLKTRLEKLKKEIDKTIERINKGENTEMLEIIKIYYNEYKK